MDHPQFEAVKVALKQTREGYVLTLNIHPDDLDERILRDFVGSRYMVVMARLNEEEQPMDRDKELPKAVKLAGLLCRDKKFHEYLVARGEIFEASAKEATEWLRETLGVSSRSELGTNHTAAARLKSIHQDYKSWTQND